MRQSLDQIGAAVPLRIFQGIRGSGQTAGDGALGFWKAIDEVFPGTRHQRCWVHKTANVLNKVALSVQINVKTDLREIWSVVPRGR
jgi:transposase-like protein